MKTRFFFLLITFPGFSYSCKKGYGLNFKCQNNGTAYDSYLDLPQKAGTFKSGCDFGAGEGTLNENRNVFLVSGLHLDEKVYAFSPNPYGRIDRIEGANVYFNVFESSIKRVKYQIGRIGHIIGYTGIQKLKFAGTCKTANRSKSLSVTKGRLYLYQYTLPAGAEVVKVLG